MAVIDSDMGLAVDGEFISDVIATTYITASNIVKPLIKNEGL